MFSHVSLTTTTHLSHVSYICHHMDWPFPCANQTSKEVHHAGIESLARTPTANVRNGLHLESHPVSKPLQAIRRINQANMFSHVSLTTTTHLSHVSYICHHMDWPFPCANQTSKEVHHAGIESLARTPTANVRNGLRLESHPVSKPLQAIRRINQANMFSHVSLPATTLLSHVSYICHHMSMDWPFPCGNQTSKEVHHAGIESLARTPTANVRNGLRLESHPVSKPLQAIRRINQANMFSHVSRPATTPLSHLSYICYHMSMDWPFPCANQTSKEVHHVSSLVCYSGSPSIRRPPKLLPRGVTWELSPQVISTCSICWCVEHEDHPQNWEWLVFMFFIWLGWPHLSGFHTGAKPREFLGMGRIVNSYGLDPPQTLSTREVELSQWIGCWKFSPESPCRSECKNQSIEPVFVCPVEVTVLFCATAQDAQLAQGKNDQKYTKIQGYSNKNMSFIIDPVLPVMSRLFCFFWKYATPKFYGLSSFCQFKQPFGGIVQVYRSEMIYIHYYFTGGWPPEIQSEDLASHLLTNHSGFSAIKHGDSLTKVEISSANNQ